MITLNVGPSRLTDQTKKDLASAIEGNVAEISHRSEEFSRLSEMTIAELRKYLGIPDDFHVFYTSSATTAMQHAVNNCCSQSSFHFVCGSFSNLFFKVAKAQGKLAQKDEVELGSINDLGQVQVPEEADLICITQNETSTGARVTQSEISKISTGNSQAIIAVDITSSAGADELQIADADIWLFSVQKCFGLPSGLGIMIVSPKAVERSKLLCQKNSVGYFSFENMLTKMDQLYQTLYTPNILNIYLLGAKLQRWNQQGGLAAKTRQTLEKERLFSKFIESSEKLEYLLADRQHRSKTVFCVAAEQGLIKKVHQHGTEGGYLLGKGYGELKERSFRIANFPSIGKADIEKVIEILSKVG
jgi:phosphoserine aminotransferase